MSLNGSTQQLPFVTIILPIRNEAAWIEACLNAILNQDYPADRMEILVVDGRSTDQTQTIVCRLIEQTARIRLLDNPPQIVPTALNIGLKEAQGQIIIRIDGHTIVALDYVRSCVTALQSDGADCVGGPMVAEGRTPFGEAVALATSHLFGVGNSHFHYATQVMESETAYMGAYRREIFDRVGYFDEEMVRNQDDEFHYRLRAGGGRIMLYPTIRSIYFNRSTAKSLWRQYFQYGFWKVRVAQKLPNQMRLRHFIPFGLVTALTGGIILAPFSRLIRWSWLGLTGLYLLLDLAVSLNLARESGWRHFKRLPVVFPILHLAYGSGFAWGLVRFARHWRQKS